MAQKLSIPLTVMANTTPPRQAASSMLYWDGRSDERHNLETNTAPEHEQQYSFRAKGPLVTERRAQGYWLTNEIHLIPPLSLATMAWEQEAKLVSFSLNAAHLMHPTHEELPGATGELVWIPRPEQPVSFAPSVRPVLLVHTPSESLLAEHAEVVLSLQAHDPLLHHIALVLQAVIKGEDLAGQLYAEILVDALAVHFLRRYRTSRRSPREVAGGLSSYKLQRTTAYIKDHLEQKLSLATLAAVGEMSPAHFARLFKHATGLAPHQYVIACRMEQAKHLLTETDLPLSEIGLQVGCADQSHFTALFRLHVSLTPKAYRDHTKSGDLTVSSLQAPTPQ